MCCRCKAKPRAKGCNYCRDCRNASVRKWEDKQGGSWAWIMADPERHKKALARKMVYNWVKRGKMERKPCEVCGDPDSQSHHDDYDKALEVRWLCQKHHDEADKKKEALDRLNKAR
jgi:hypothetical protein